MGLNSLIYHPLSICLPCIFYTNRISFSQNVMGKFWRDQLSFQSTRQSCHWKTGFLWNILQTSFTNDRSVCNGWFSIGMMMTSKVSLSIRYGVPPRWIDSILPVVWKQRIMLYVVVRETLRWFARTTKSSPMSKLSTIHRRSPKVTLLRGMFFTVKLYYMKVIKCLPTAGIHRQLPRLSTAPGLGVCEWSPEGL